MMEVTITRFRKEIFSLASQALEGKEIWFTHKGKRVKLVPEEAESTANQPVAHWFDRLTPMEIINPDWVEPAVSLQQEMEAEWAKDWADL